MTTTEKRGFRLPWGAENRKPDPDSGDTSSHAADAPRKANDLAAALAPDDAAATGDVRSAFRRGNTDDLGRGPFGLGPVSEREPSSDADDALVDVVDPAPKKLEAQPEPEPEAEPVPPVATAEPVDPTAWPDMDRRGSAAHLAADVPLPPRPAIVIDGAQRRANPLMAGLVKAMRDAARAARDETTARLRADAAARIDEIKAESIATAAGLRKQADADITAIREWSKAETARIKQETETRIAGRRSKLVEQIQDHGATAERMTEEVRGGIAGFEAEMDRFFEILLKEEDPARLATLAERLPEAPSFARPSGEAASAPRRSGPRSSAPRRPTDPTRRKPRPGRRLAPDAAAAAEAEAIAGLDDEPAMAVAETVPAETVPADTLAGATGAGPDPEADAAPAAVVEPVETPLLETEPVALVPADGGHEHDTNGHEAVAAEPDMDAEALAAWTEALAAMRIGAGLGDDGPAPAEGPSVDGAETFDPDLGGEPAAPAGSLLAVLHDAPRIDSPDDLSPEERIALLGFDETASPDPEPDVVPDAHVEDVTRVVVSGLTSVAGISSFKSALSAVAGVLSVSVTSGNDGAFVFSVVHAGTTDLRAAVPALARFSPEPTGDEGAVLSFAVTEPAT